MTIEIYLLGIIISLIVGRYTNRYMSKAFELSYGWKDVIVNIIVSSLSYIGVACWLIIILIHWIININVKIDGPPKWM